MRRARTPAIVLLLLLVIVASTGPLPVLALPGASVADLPRTGADEELAERAVERLKEYLRIDTVNPPGNEIRGAEFFARVFDAEGVDYEIVEPAPGRGNIWARLEGGDEPGIVLLHHMDVVPADAEHWSVDPLGAEVRDGFLYGRGALDTKSLGILHLQAFLALHRSGEPLSRDVVFMATADEEAGGFQGAGWLVENRPELFDDVGFVLNEGGGSERDDGAVTVSVEVTQKVPLWLRLVAEDEAGHGSMPRRRSAVTRLVRALDRIAEHAFEPRIVPAVDRYFRAIAETAEEPWRGAYRDMETAVQDRDLLTRLQIRSPFLHALTRNTCSMTVLEGSDKINVVPPQATAQLDCRLLPDQDPEAFVRELRTVINDRSIRVEEIMRFSPAVSDADTELFRAIESVTRRHHPESRVIPSVLTGFTDSHFFRDLGLVAYGYDPMVVSPEDVGRIHGNDERVPLDQVRAGTKIMVELLRELAVR